jgi:hypothetical protein
MATGIGGQTYLGLSIAEGRGSRRSADAHPQDAAVPHRHVDPIAP